MTIRGSELNYRLVRDPNYKIRLTILPAFNKLHNKLYMFGLPGGQNSDTAFYHQYRRGPKFSDRHVCRYAVMISLIIHALFAIANA